MDCLSYVKWINRNTNAALKGQEDIRAAQGYSSLAGVPRHPDAPKTWDNYLALHHCISTTPENHRVLDAGGCRDSVFLEGLKRKGYTSLANINIDEPNPETTTDGVTWVRGDITTSATREAGPFSFVACLSVIEHGVDIPSFFEEMKHAVMPGGHLFISTDYWPQGVDTRGQQAFGAPVKVFDFDDVWRMSTIAAQNKFDRAGSTLDLLGRDRVINWLGMDYTFVNLLFRRR